MVSNEASQAEDLLTTTVYSVHMKEKSVALNIVDSLEAIQTFLRRVLANLDTDIPEIKKRVKNHEKSCVFGEDLESHLK